MSRALLALGLLLALPACRTTRAPSSTSTAPTTASTREAEGETAMSPSPTEKVVALLRSIETGDPAPVGYINPASYTQHNLGVADGLAGFGEVLAQLPEGSARARPVRVFQDGDFVVAHTEYDFFGPKIGFDIFRFEDGLIVEHWDNLQETAGPNPSGRSMIDGPTQVTDRDATEANKALVRGFVDDILMNGRMDRIGSYIGATYHQHNPAVADGLDGLAAAFEAMAAQGVTMVYEANHAILGEGNFVLSVSEGQFGGQHVSFYDLFRVEGGRIVEHWDTIETILPRDQWRNDNGKFGGL